MKRKYIVYILMFIVFFFGSFSQLKLWSLGPLYSYAIKPILWIFIFLIVYLFYPKRNAPYNFRKKAILEYALIAALSYVVFYYFLGIIVGYQHSPYSRSTLGIIKNLWMILGFYIPREIVRDIFIKGTFRPNRKLVFVFLTIVMSLTEISYSNYLNLTGSLAGFIEVTIKSFIPIIGLNIFLTYLSFKESYRSPLIYILIIKIVSIITPVFPNEIFFLNVIIEFLIPVFTYIKIENFIEKYNRVVLFQEDVSIRSRIALVSFLILLLLFTTRLLPYMPTVILSNSMYPQIDRGDMIISQKDYNKIDINDIIEFRQGNMLIIHRVVNIINTSKGKIYITKGDNNKQKDSGFVTEDQITGKIVFTIPKIGYPTIWAREFLKNVRGIEVEEGVR